MSSNVKISFDGPDFDTLRRAFVVGMAKIANKADLANEIGDALVSETVNRFRTQTAPDGTTWQPSQRAIDEGGLTLIDSGILRDSITHQYNQDQLEIGSNLVYAGVHQDGFDDTSNISAHTRTIRQAFGKKLKAPITANVRAHKRHMVISARPYLGLSAADKHEILTILRGRVKEAGFAIR